MGHSMDTLTGLQAGAVHITLHSILDQVTDITTVTPVVTTTDKVTPETTETEDTNKTQGTTKDTRTIRTGTTTKIEIGLTTGDGQINTNTTETSQQHKSYSNTLTRIYQK